MLWVIVPSGRTADSYLWMIGLRFQTLFSRALCSQLTNSFLTKSPRALFFFFFFFSSYQSNRQIVAYCFPPAHKCRNGDNLHKRQCQHFCHVGACHSRFDGNRHHPLPFSVYQDTFQPLCWIFCCHGPLLCLEMYNKQRALPNAFDDKNMLSW